MRHPLNWLVRIRRSPEDAQALLGDITEQYLTLTSANGGRWAALRGQAWYLRELLAAVIFAMSGDREPALAATQPNQAFFRLRLLPDVRYALRRWRRRPAFAATAIVTLALGIAAATAIFSIVDAVLLRPLPWTHPESLVVIHGVYPERRNNVATASTWNRWLVSYPAWDALRTTPVFDSVAAWRPLARLDSTLGEDRRQIVKTMDVSSAFLPMLGVKVILGRYFTDGEDKVNNDSVILTHETWMERFDGRPEIIGQVITLGSASAGGRYPKTVVGVLEPRFTFDGQVPEILFPVGVAAEVLHRYPSPTFRIVARLAPGVTLHAAESVAAALVSAAPAGDQTGTARLVSIEEQYLGAARRPLWLLFGGAGLLLLVACSNVAGLLLGEARVRRHEIAVRAALGGSRMRVIRQLVVEHTLMAIAGSVLGLVMAYWLLGSIVAIAPEGLPRLETVTIDRRVAAFAFGSGLLTLLLFGVAPAVMLSRTRVSSVLAEGGRDGAPRRLLGQRAVVIAQMVLALVLLTGAGLFGETMFRLRSQPLGFDPTGVAIVSTTFTGNRFGDPARVKALRQSNPADLGAGMTRLITETYTDLSDRAMERILTLPGVTSAAASLYVPFVDNAARISAVMNGRPDDERHDVLQHVVTDGYFDTMGIRVRSGRGFQRADQSGERLAVVSREFERRFFPNGAVAQEFRQVYGEHFELSARYRIVGVVDDVKRQEYTDDDRPAYYAYNRQGGPVYHFIVKSSGDPAAILAGVRDAIGAVSPQLVVTAMTTLKERVDRSAVDEAFRATLSAIFGAAALALAAIGLYGLVTRRAADRRREFGVRVALGASPSDVGRLVVLDGLVIVTVGLVIGLPASFAAAQVTSALLFGVTPTSLHVFVMTAATLALVALFATILPALRASRTNPILALKD